MNQHNFELKYFKKRIEYYHNSYTEYKDKRKNYDNIHRHEIYHYSRHYHTPPSDNDAIDLSRYNLYTIRGKELAIIRRRQKHKKVNDGNKQISKPQKSLQTLTSIQEQIQLQLQQQVQLMSNSDKLNNSINFNI